LPLVSVILPVYNAQGSVGAALDCLRAQTLADLDILVADDGSTDGSALEVQRRVEADPRVRLLRLPHRGVVGTMNAGLAATDSALVARMDADDLCAPQRLARQVEFLAATGLDLCDSLVTLGATPGLTGQGMHDYVDWLNSLTAPGAMHHAILQESPVVQPATLVTRAALARIGGYEDGPFPEDYQFWLRLAAAGVRFGKVPEYLFTWNDPPGRLTRTDARYGRPGFVELRARYLFELFPQAARGLLVWGAGRDGRALARELAHQGRAVLGFVDVDPAKVGHRALGLPVDDYRRLPYLLPPEGLLLVAVGIPAVRQQIRQHLRDLRLEEGRHFAFAV
jgi:glycosyltransferase involved in cell wall biosynthesis